MKDMRINQTGENQKQKTNIPKGWAEEWDSTVEAIRESAGVRNLLKKEWDKTVLPFRRKGISIWRS